MLWKDEKVDFLLTREDHLILLETKQLQPNRALFHRVSYSQIQSNDKIQLERENIARNWWEIKIETNKLPVSPGTENAIKLIMFYFNLCLIGYKVAFFFLFFLLLFFFSFFTNQCVRHKNQTQSWMTIGTELKTALYVKFALIHPDSGSCRCCTCAASFRVFFLLKTQGK